MKCNDCGQSNYEPSSVRSDICEQCWQLRGLLVDSVSAGKIDQDEFRQIQLVLASGNGKGANTIRRVLGIDGFKI